MKENLESLKTVLQESIEILEKKVPYAAAFAQETEGLSFRVDSKQEAVQPVEPNRGVVLSAFNGREFLEYAVSDLSLEAIKGATEGLLQQIEAVGVFDEGVVIHSGPEVVKDFHSSCQIDPDSIPTAEKLEKIKEYQMLLQEEDSLIVNAVSLYNEHSKEDLFVNRNKVLYQDLKRGESIFLLVMVDGERSSQMHGGRGAQGGWENSYLSRDFIREHVEDCKKTLHAKRLSPGSYDCVFDPTFSGIFAHEAFGHGMETDMFLKKRAKGQEFLGEYVASRLVNMYDNPALAAQAGSYFFDDEGELARETQIIKEGKLVSGITDLNSSSRLNLLRTPNGRRQNYSHKSYARMTNTYFGPGSHKFSEMIGSIEKGFYLKHATNGMEDPKGWGIQLEGLYAEEIKNGKLTGQVFSPVIVTGYVPDLLTSITMVGTETEIGGLGMCGKGHKEWIKVTDGGPHLKLQARIA